MAVHHHYHHSGDDGCFPMLLGGLVGIGILIYAVGVETAAIGAGLLLGIYFIGQSKGS